MDEVNEQDRPIGDGGTAVADTTATATATATATTTSRDRVARGPGGKFVRTGGDSPRSPGRSRKTQPQAASEPAGPQTLTVEQTPAGGQAKRERPATARKPRTVSASEANASASMYLLMLDLAARSVAGPDAALTSYERALIEPPLSRILARHGAVNERLASLADPLALLIGLAMWGGRVYRSMAATTPAPRTSAPGVSPAAQQEPPPPVAPPPPEYPIAGSPELLFDPAPDMEAAK